MSRDETFPVVIIGGGLAGLSAGVYLAARGIPPLVLDESSKWIGGRLCSGDPDTFEYKGKIWAFKPEHGVHALWGGYVNMTEVVECFTETELQPSKGEAWINRWQRDVRVVEAGSVIRSSWLPAPFHYLQLLFRPRFWTTITPLDFLSLPGFLVSLLLTVGFNPIQEMRPLDGLMMKEYFRGWTPNLRATFAGVGTNLLAASEDQISLTGFIAAIRYYTMLRKDAWYMRFLPGNAHDFLIQPLVDSIHSNEGLVWDGITAQSLHQDDDIWKIVVEDDKRGGMRSIYAEHVIIATSSSAAQRLLSSSKDTNSDIESMNFPSTLRTLTVRLWFDIQPKIDAVSGMCTGDFEVDNYFWLHQLYDEFKAWRDVGGSAVEVHIYGSEKMLDQPDHNLMIIAINDIQHAFPELKGHFVHGVVRRNSRTQTKFRVPDQRTLGVETPWSNVYACGDWIRHPTESMWMERSVTTGKAAANYVLNQYDQPTWEILSPPPPEVSVRFLSIVVRVMRRAFRPILSVIRLIRRKTP